MKKLLFVTLILALFNSVSASADVVSLDKATAAARQYFNDGAVTRAGAIEPVLAWTYNEVTKGPYAPAFYVFNNPQGGWMIISGEDACHAILAHSDTGSFDPQNLPDNTAWWLDGYAEQIEWARMNYLKQDAQTAAEWNDLLSGNIRKTTVNPQCPTPSWGQNAPFNIYCPYYKKSDVLKQSVTGCVATALAEVMYYHAKTRGLKLPKKGYGIIGGYTPSGDKPIFNQDGSSIATLESIDLTEDSGYDWENMLDSYPHSSSGNSDQREAVAKLMYHCGLMSEMSYGSGSSADEDKAVKALIEHMGYDSGAHIEFRSAYTEGDWISLLKNEIVNNRPVILRGSGSGAHEFVADGFSDPDEFHMNWGWSGSGNAWFKVSGFQPTDDNGGEHDYRVGLNAMVGVFPSDNPTYTVNNPFLLRIYSLSMDSGSINSDGSYTVYYMVLNSSSQTVSFDLYVYIYNYKDDESTRVLSSNNRKRHTDQTSNKSIGYKEWQCACNNYSSSKPYLGDKIRLCYVPKDGNSNDSKPILAKYTYLSINDNIPIYDIPFISVKDGGIYHVNDYFDFVITNSRTVPNDMTIDWYFDEDEVTLDEKTLQASRLLTSEDAGKTHTIKADVTIGGVTQTLVQEITVVE